MSEQVFGIPSQIIMDMLTIISSSESDYPVVHCKGIEYISFGIRDINTGWYTSVPCVPANPSKFPNWKCLKSENPDAPYDHNDHHGCYKLNANCKPGQEVWYCTCDRITMLDATEIYTHPKGAVATIRNYYINRGECDKYGYYKCLGCLDGKC